MGGGGGLQCKNSSSHSCLGNVAWFNGDSLCLSLQID